jgi:D-alanyl-D-alanine carboxypeptidase/D-alanyl-D-alanine-endopeptidase (penicillin-binding protein 4)
MLRRPAALALAVAGLLWLGPRPGLADADGTEARTVAAVQEILDDPDLPTAHWGLLVQDARTGRVVLSRNAQKSFLPASTLKLLTTAAALDRLGTDFRYTTRLYQFGRVAPDGTLRGDLVVRGAGDPTFGSETDPLEAWAEALAASGLRRVEGRIVGDDDAFEDARYSDGWDVSHIATESYAPASGGLAWDDNLLSIRIEAGAPGGPARFESIPAGFATVRGTPTTQRGRGRLVIDRTLGTDEFALRGGVPAGYRGALQVPVANPTLYAVHAFAERLAEAGVDVSDAALVDVDDLDAPLDYTDVEPIQTARSPRLAEIVERVNVESDNLYAEHLFRTLGDGTVDDAADAVEAFVERAGADPDGLRIADGSGLSRKDLVTPEALAAVLREMRRHPAGAAFRSSLPGGGAEGSTLRSRLDDVPVRAKTGSLLGVRCLAGYVRGPEGAPYVFVLMANHYTERGGPIARAQDAIVRALATGERPPVEEDE